MSATRWVLVAGLVVALVAIGYSVVPFDAAGNHCDHAVVSRNDRTVESPGSPASSHGAYIPPIPPTPGGQLTACALQARRRLATSGIVLGLDLLGILIAIVIVRTRPDAPISN